MTQDVIAFANCVKSDTLSQNEANVLAVNLLPQYAKATEEEKAIIAGVSYPTWYRILRRDGYKAALRAACRQVFITSAPKVQHKYMDLAMEGDRIACEKIMQEAGVMDRQAEGSTVNIYQQINAAEAQETIGAQWHNVIDGEDTTDHDVNEVKE